MWAIATALGMFMIGRGAWTLLQPWGNAWFKLFGIGFCVCLTGFALYKESDRFVCPSDVAPEFFVP
jgi:hypothetical protein